ncbi:hypothetical protein [Ramlibacter sp.]
MNIDTRLTVAGLFAQRVRSQPGAPALQSQDRTLSYAQLAEAPCRRAA